MWLDGRVVGGWAQRRDGEIAVKLLEDVGADAAALVQAEAARLPGWLGALRVIQAAVGMIDASGGSLSIRDLADRFGWSQKHFERLFTHYVGFVRKSDEIKRPLTGRNMPEPTMGAIVT